MPCPAVDMARELDREGAFEDLSRKLERTEHLPGMFVPVLTSAMTFDGRANVCMATIYKLS
jgi:hypothetical protein